MLTVPLPKTARRFASALIFLRLIESCNWFFLMYSQSFLTTLVRGRGLEPTTFAKAELGVKGFMKEGLGFLLVFFFGLAFLAATFLFGVAFFFFETAFLLALDFFDLEAIFFPFIALDRFVENFLLEDALFLDFAEVFFLFEVFLDFAVAINETPYFLWLVICWFDLIFFLLLLS